MTRLETLLLSLVDTLPLSSGEVEDGVGIGVVELALEFPIEHRFVDGELWASPPRTRLRTGFDSHAGRLRMRFRRSEAAP